jgi:DNA polymerase-3 subunit alpha
MDLKEFYDTREVPDKERVISLKNIVLTVPAGDYDVKPALAALDLSRFEVNVLWPRGKTSPEEEALFLHPRLVVQLGKQFSRRFPFVPDGSLPDEALRQRAQEATADKYVVLHHHDEFSLQDGLGTAAHLGDLLQEQRRSFMAVTNHGSLGGWIKQYNVCKARGLKCIFGMEAYREDYRGDDPEEKKKHRSAYHLVLLARTKEGFDNIIRIHNDAQLNGFYYSPRVNWEAIRKWGKGIIALTACAAGDIPRALMAGDEAKAEEIFKGYVEAFDKVYIELQIVEMEEQREINRRLIKFAEKVGAETVLSSDSHYLDPSYSETHSLLMYIRQKKTVLEAREVDADVWDFDVSNLFYRNAAQMEEPFRNGFTTKDRVKRAPFLDEVFTEDVFRRSMAMTRKIAMDIEDISLDSKIKLPKLYPDSEKILRENVNAGFKRLGLGRLPNAQEYKDRVKLEYDIITKLGFADYFLITEKIVKYAKETFGEWTVGFGRGSGAGSVIAWCLGITDVNPIRYGLLFERFLDDSRQSIYVCTFDE